MWGPVHVYEDGDMTSSYLWHLVVHWDDGDVEDKTRDGAAMLVTDREDKLDQQWFWSDVFHWGHEGHLPVQHSMLGEKGRVNVLEYFGSLVQSKTKQSKIS